MAEAADESMLLLDIAPVSILVADHKGDFIRVVARNTMIPNRKTKSIVLASDNTQQVEVSLFFGEANNKLENFWIRSFTLTGLDGIKQGTKIGELTIETDVNNVITMTLENVITGKKITAQLPSADSLISDLDDYVQRILNGGSALQDAPYSDTIEL